MGLFEIATGYIGCSYERCYVWAETRERAAELFREQHTEREIEEVALIVHCDDGEFITELNDEGVGDRIAR